MVSIKRGTVSNTLLVLLLTVVLTVRFFRSDLTIKLWNNGYATAFGIPQFNVHMARRLVGTDDFVDTPLNSEGASTSNAKVILLWTRDKSNETIWKHDMWGHEPFVFERCEYSDCLLTMDRSRLREADVVYFNYHDDPDWPDVRLPHQLWVHKMNERPGQWHSWLKEKDYEGKFNLSMSYRSDSDISLLSPAHSPRHPYRSDPYVPKIPLSDRKHSVIWAVSNCMADSKRQNYVSELAKHINVHIYGKCGNFTCLRDDMGACYQHFESNYKFLIGFENAFCKDYVTEKLSMPLRYEIIPIVMGYANYSLIAPPHSVINVMDYPSPKALAEYLNQLVLDEAAYNEYFQWKQKYTIAGFKRVICGLCEAASNDKYKRPAHDDYLDWWFGGCDNNRVRNMLVQGHW